MGKRGIESELMCCVCLGCVTYLIISECYQSTSRTCTLTSAQPDQSST